MTTNTIIVEQIKVGDRMRVDLGDVEDLAQSIQRFGLIQPVVLDDQNNLIAGGRRLAAAKALGWLSIPACYLGTLTEDERAELELEENVRRKDMTWQERVLAIETIHKKKQLNKALAGEAWGVRETGELTGVHYAQVSYALWAAERIRTKDERVMACTNMNEVLKEMLQRKEDEVLASLATEPALYSNQVDEGQTYKEQHPAAYVQTMNCLHGDALSIMQNCISSGVFFDHIITDPPYAINMDNIQQDGGGMDVSRTAEEHDEEENVHLLEDFLELAYKVTNDHAFCVFWTDQDTWDSLKVIAEDYEWRVQRWPLIWVKTDPCQNMCAQYNYTKRAEIAMVLRKPNATLACAQPSNWLLCAGVDKAQFSHPFAKPVDLHTWVINAVSHPGQTILDPFAGSGTLPYAAILVGRNPWAIELVEGHRNECLENMKRAYKLVFGENVQFV